MCMYCLCICRSYIRTVVFAFMLAFVSLRRTFCTWYAFCVMFTKSPFSSPDSALGSSVSDWMCAVMRLSQPQISTNQSAPHVLELRLSTNHLHHVSPNFHMRFNILCALFILFVSAPPVAQIRPWEDWCLLVLV